MLFCLWIIHLVWPVPVCLQVPSVDYEQVKKTIEAELGKSMEEVFLEFDHQPTAAASLAQVHKAVLLDGTPVAVKVQYPRVGPFLEIDLKVHEIAIRVYSWFDDDFEMNDETLKMIHTQLRRELDFRIEGSNAIKARENFSNNHKVYVPLVLQKLTTEHVLTMEWISGMKINDLKSIQIRGWNRADIAETVISCLSEQMFLYGFLHADPHPGNIFLRPNPDRPEDFQVVLLDHGLYVDIHSELRKNFATYWKYLVLQDTKKLEELCQIMQIKHPHLFASMMLMQSFDSIQVTEGIVQDFHHQYENNQESLDPMYAFFKMVKQNQVNII
jgi:aarF domain-containing kinase